MEIVILVGLVSALAAGFACAAEHGYAERHGWGVLVRYGAGAFTWLVACAPVFLAATMRELITTPVAILLYGMICWIIAGAGIGTVVCYRPNVALPDEDELEAKINGALRK